MTTLHRQIHTFLANDDAFAFVADFGNAMRWDPGVATSERLDDGPVAEGSRFALGVRLGGRVVPMEYRITSLRAPTSVELTGDGSNVHAVDTISFASSGSGTRIDYTADIRLGGLLRLAQPFLGGRFERLAEDAVEGMRRALDERADASVHPSTDSSTDATADPGRS